MYCDAEIIPKRGARTSQFIIFIYDMLWYNIMTINHCSIFKAYQYEIMITKYKK